MSEERKPKYPPNCGACSYFDTEFERGYYGDSSSYARCSLGKWQIDIEFDDAAKLRASMRTALTCPDFTPETP